MTAIYTPTSGPGSGIALYFRLLIDPPTRQTQQLMSERVIPGSDRSIVDRIGKTVTKIRGSAEFDSYDALKTFEGVVGTSGNLFYSEEPEGLPVEFVSMERTRVVPGDIHLASVEFWIIPPGTTVRALMLQATVAGVPMTNLLSARVSFGFDVRTSQATLQTPIKPACTYDDVVAVTLGAGTNNIARFVGLVRDFSYSQNPPRVTTICKGWLTKADEYENVEPADAADVGLLLSDLVGTDLADSATIVKAVLDKASVPYNAAYIGGTSAQYGDTLDPFIWLNGSSSTPNIDINDAGETALAYIERYDAIDAVFDAEAGTGGRYATFETLPDADSNTVFRTLIGGRPWADEDFTFFEGVDILDGQFSRSISQTRNYFLVTGYDQGDGGGPEYFPLQTGNDFQPETTRHTQRISSPMIERSNDADDGTGMSCETVANALSLEYNREIVKGWIETFRDDRLGIGQVHMVRTVSGIPGWLGVGEKLWAQSLDITVDEQGFTQRVDYIGGGLPPPPLEAVTL